MLKKITIKKICLSSFCLLVLLLIYLFPKKNNNFNFQNTVYKQANLKDVVFLEDENGYISRITTYLNGDNTIEKVKSIINVLKKQNNNINNFKSLIPHNTIINSIKLEKDTLYIDFSSDFLKVTPKKSEKMIESIVYSLTELDNVNNIYLSVDNTILDSFPNTSIKMQQPLNREIGVNKIYDIDSIKNTTKTTTYFLSHNNNNIYYVPVTKVSNDKREKIEIIINELTTSNTYTTSLKSYLNAKTALNSYEILDKKMILDFNNALFVNSINKDIEEEVTYSINLSIKDSYNVDEVLYSVDNNKIATFNLKELD